MTVNRGPADHFDPARMEYLMTYTLDAFIKEAKSALKDNEGPAGREKVRTMRVYEGPSEVHRMVIARRILGGR